MDKFWSVVLLMVQIFAIVALLLPAYWLVSSLFWKGEVGKDMRRSYLVYLPFILIVVISIIVKCCK